MLPDILYFPGVELVQPLADILFLMHGDLLDQLSIDDFLPTLICNIMVCFVMSENNQQQQRYLNYFYLFYLGVIKS